MDVIRAPEPLDMTPAAMGVELAMLRASLEKMNARATGLEEQIKATIRTGRDVPGWTMEPGLGREVWTVPDTTVIAAANALGVSVAAPRKAITPKQAREAGMPLHLMPEFTQTLKTALELVPDTARRMRRIFGGRA
jgi:hypothetical protein